jgi:hypothetical protein
MFAADFEEEVLKGGKVREGIAFETFHEECTNVCFAVFGPDRDILHTEKGGCTGGVGMIICDLVCLVCYREWVVPCNRSDLRVRSHQGGDQLDFT